MNEPTQLFSHAGVLHELVPSGPPFPTEVGLTRGTHQEYLLRDETGRSVPCEGRALRSIRKALKELEVQRRMNALRLRHNALRDAALGRPSPKSEGT